jgi:hypothetical protein
MNIIRGLTLALLLAIAALAATPAQAGPARTLCTDVLNDTVVPGDLLVPEGVYCELNNVTVQGDARIQRRSTLAIHDSRVDGDITGSRFELVLLRNATVGGHVRLTSGVSTWIEEGTTVEGDVRFSDGHDARVLGSEVLGDLTIRGTHEQVQFCGATVGGDARFASNEGWVFLGGGLEGCAPNEVRGTMRVHHNLQETTVANNTVGRDLVCAANEPAPTVYDNRVSGRARGQCGAGEAVAADELGEAR